MPLVKLVCTQTYFASVLCYNVVSLVFDLCVHSARVINKMYTLWRIAMIPAVIQGMCATCMIISCMPLYGFLRT